MFAEPRDDEQIIELVAALDIGKAEIVCCIRLRVGGIGSAMFSAVRYHRGRRAAGAGGVHALDDGHVVV